MVGASVSGEGKMPRLDIVQPRPDAVVIAEQDFTVSGVAIDRGQPEPIMIDSVSVRVDNGPAIEAALTPGHPSPETVFNFEAQTRVSATQGPHTISVTAVNDRGRSATRSVTVFVGAGPLVSNLAGTVTLRTSSPNSRLMAPPPGAFAGVLEFSFDRSSLRILSVAPIVVTIPDLPLIGSVTLTITRRLGEGAGTFDSATGTLTQPLGVHFSYSTSIPFLLDDSDVDFGFPTGSPLTTGTVTSPSGLLSATGSPRNAASGAITLVGASRFSGGPPLAGLDCSLMLSGTVSPIP
jgi:hypothetical protein